MKILLLMVLLAAYPALAEDDPAVIAAQAKLGAQLKDPESARFTGLVIAPGKGLVCGWVNAKNSYGGYVGYQPFFVMGDSAVIRDNDSAGDLNNHDLFAAVWRICVPPIAEKFGDTFVDLPRLDAARQCAKRRRAMPEKPELLDGCELRENEALVWLRSHPTAEWIARECSVAARQYNSYLRTRTCVEDGEANIVFRRGPPAATQTP
jgi:hypothetical protein